METSREDIYRRMAEQIASGQPTVDPPEGFEPMGLSDPFEALLGPFFVKTDVDETGAERVVTAFRADPRHLNANEIVHGGCLMAFADSILGGVAWNAIDKKPCVTLSLQTSFLKAVRKGEVIECTARLTRKTRSILFISGEFCVECEPVMTVTSLWKVLNIA